MNSSDGLICVSAVTEAVVTSVCVPRRDFFLILGECVNDVVAVVSCGKGGIVAVGNSYLK